MDTSERNANTIVNAELVAAIEQLTEPKGDGRPPGSFTSAELKRASGWGENRTHERLRDAVHAGVLVAEEGTAPTVTGRLGRAVYYRTVETGAT